MTDAESYRLKAESFLQRAAHAVRRDQRIEYMELSAHWLELARQAEEAGALADKANSVVIPFPGAHKA